MLALLTSGAANAQQSPIKLTASEANAAALARQIVLIDIRTPDEWRETGVAASAHAITMHQKQEEFLRELAAVTGGSTSAQIALICAVGNRSANLQAWLRRAGYTNVSDVAEGMIGGPRGVGWIKSGLPLRQWLPGRSAPSANSP